MIKCIAVDDEPLALEQLTGYIARVPFLQLIASCQDAFSAMQVLSEEEVDLMFVDIHMPDRLALVTTRKAFTLHDFLYWFAGKAQRASRDELICTTIIDACLDRLAAEGQRELIAALLCGDRKTFELFRCDAPELMHLPDATYEWFEENYLRGFYPMRYMLKFNGVQFPEASDHDEG